MDAAAIEQALNQLQGQIHAQAQQIALQQQQLAAAAAAAAAPPQQQQAAAAGPPAHARRVKIPSASNYAGSPALLDGWLREMKQQFDWYQLLAAEEQVAMSAAQLRGVALDWWSAQLSAAEQAALRASFALFETALRARFQPVNSAQAARLALDSLRQGAKQSVHEYTSAFRRLLVSVPDMSEADKVHRFVQGLRGPAQTQLIVHGADTLDKAIGMAARVGSLSLYAASSAAMAGGAPMDLNMIHGGSELAGEGGDAVEPAFTVPIPYDAPVSRVEFQQLLAAMQAHRGGAGQSGQSRGGKRSAFGGRGPPRVQGLSEQEVRKRLDEGLCFVCGESGHRKFDCPQKKEKSF